jgi:hypothetical protein
MVTIRRPQSTGCDLIGGRQSSIGTAGIGTAKASGAALPASPP